MLILFGIIFYLLGSIPFGFLVAKAVKNIDIRKYGSGSIGSTNVVRVIGKPFGILVFILDFLKGFLPVVLTHLIFKLETQQILFISIFLVFGHNWPVFLGFRGGKGVAVSLAIFFGLAFVVGKLWLCIISGILSWILVFFITRYVSLASLISSLVFFLISIFLIKDFYLNLFILFLLSLIVIRHSKNIKNLINKKEFKFNRR